MAIWAKLVPPKYLEGVGMKYPITVLHYRADWLPLTENWIYNQIVELPPSIRSRVVCERCVNKGQFIVPGIHCLADSPFPVRWWNLCLRRLGLRHYLGFLNRALRNEKAAILHSHFGHYGWANMNAVPQGVKHVVTFYGLDVNYLPTADERWKFRYRQLFNRVDRILCEGPHMAHCIVGLGCPREKVLIHHLGVRTDRIPFRPRSYVTGEPLRVLIAASFREKKGITYALEALERIAAEIKLEVTLIGDAGNDARSKEEKQKILHIIQRNGLGPKLRMLGYQPYDVLMEEAYRHHVFLSPSVTGGDGDTEGGAPVSIIDMLASGMLVVSTNHCDIPAIVKHDHWGLLAAERDVEGLASHLKWLVDNPGHWHDMLVEGRAHVEREFNAEVQGSRLGEIYRELVANQ